MMSKAICKRPGHIIKSRANGEWRFCATCHKEKGKLRSKEKAEDIKKYNIAYHSSLEGHCKALLARIKRADPNCNLVISDLLTLWNSQNGKCAITGSIMSLQKGEGRQPSAISIDRICPALGYTKGNVRFICDIVNLMKNKYTDAELLMWSKRVVTGMQATGTKTILVPNFSTVADIVDRLIVEVTKLGFYENVKRQESLKPSPDLELIVKYDRLSRDCCEYRDMLKTAINQVLEDIVLNQHYQTIPSSRTFLPPKKTVADILAEQCEEISKSTFEKLNGR